MDFKNILQRYHISPLRYEDGTELDERDYKILYLVLKKYFYALKLSTGKEEQNIPQGLLNKAENNYNRSLIKLDVEDIMDILMEQKGGIAHDESC